MKTYIFDLDGTLAVSKGPIDHQMQELLADLLHYRKVCVVSGGRWEQFLDQLINRLPGYAMFENLLCFPTSGASCYKFDPEEKEWKKVYELALSTTDKLSIKAALEKAIESLGDNAPNVAWGDTVEDRGTQITYSALGQTAPIDVKSKWDPDRKIRKEMVEAMKQHLDFEKFEVRIGGSTSIDVTQRGIHKGYAINRIKKMLNRFTDDLVFFGDALEPGGNDHEVYKAGVMCVPVADHIDCVWKVRMMLEAGQ